MKRLLLIADSASATQRSKGKWHSCIALNCTLSPSGFWKYSNTAESKNSKTREKVPYNSRT